MPIISKFNGLVIKMYFRQSEHNPPHIHVIYGEYLGVFEIQTGEVLEGDLPQKEQKMIQKWISIHKDELMQIWNTQNFIQIPPL